MSCFLTILAIVVIIIAIIFVYAGVLEWFSQKVVETSQLPFASMLVVYRPHVGEYKNCWLAFHEVKLLLAAVGKSSSKTFGVYYDKPEEGKNRCRYIVGAILAEGSEIEQQDPNRTEAIAHFKNNGFNELTIPKIERGLYTTFPLRCGWLSIWLAVLIVYRAMDRAMKKVDHKREDARDRGILEVYDANVIHFAFHLDEPADKILAPEFKSKSN